MNDKRIHNTDELLDDFFDQDIPQPDQNIKKITIEAAMEEFSQGSGAAARPIGNRDTSHKWFSLIKESIRSFFMNTENNRMMYNAFGTAAIAFLAVSVVFIMPSTQTDTRLEDLIGVVTESNTNKVDRTIVTNRELNNTAIEQEKTQSTAPKTATTDQLLADVTNTQIGTENQVAFGENTTSTKIVKQLSESVEKPTAINSTDRQESQAEEIVVTARKHVSDNMYSESYSNNESQAIALAPQAIREKISAINNIPFGGSTEDGSNSIETSLPAPRVDNREEYAEYQSNTVKLVADEPVSTFSIDVDTASYSLIRNQLNSGFLPKPQAVRAEELINYFDYDYPTPNSKSQPFEQTVTVLDSPWNEDKKLVHIGIKGYDIEANQQPDSNLVFLLDVSGSMNSANKLPLVKQSVSLLLDTLKPTDTVSIVVYAGAAGTVLEPTQVKDKAKIMSALQNLNAGGSTAGGAGIQLAYQLAEQNFNKEAVNRIILATDGDFNVGVQSNEDLKTLVERKRSNGVFLSVLGFGRNNYQDDMMQTLAQNGNGVAAYIDSLSEAKKVLVDEATSTLFPIAKDVKIQVEFNPTTVSEYRLIGYETRALNREDFNNDKVDAGDIGAGHTVTAIYEITPADAENKSIDEPRYAQNKPIVSESQSDEYGFLKMRYKLPDSNVSKLIETPIKAMAVKSNSEVQFSIAVASFAQLLSDSQYTGNMSYDEVINTATEHKGTDSFGYRSEFIQLVRMAQIAKP